MDNTKYNSTQKALFVIDIQEDYTGATAKPPFPYKDSDRLITTVNNIIEDAAKKNIIIVYIRQEFDGFFGKLLSKFIGNSTCIKGSTGAEIDKRINIISDYCFTKPMPDAFTNDKLNTFLNEYQIKELYLTGLDAAGCVHFTAKGALKKGYRVSIIKDGIALHQEKKWDSLLKKYEQDGINLITSQEL